MPFDCIRQMLRRYERWSESLFWPLWFFVIGVSVYDGYLVLVNRLVIATTELNPLGQWLLSLNDGDVWLLLAAKIVGTIVAGALVLLLYWTRRRLGLWVCTTLAVVQLLLLGWLHFGHG